MGQERLTEWADLMVASLLKIKRGEVTGPQAVELLEQLKNGADRAIENIEFDISGEGGYGC